MGREKLKTGNSDLQIINAETEEEYTDDNALIPKNSSVIVRRIPVVGVKSKSKTYQISHTKSVMGTTRAVNDSSAPMSLAQLIETANLAEANASEEDKIKAMMIQSGHLYNPINYMKKTPVGLPPPSYTCFRCGKPGHYIKNCPTNADKNFESRPRIRKSTGIPRSFMMEVKDPNMKGAMLTKTGQYVIPTINAEAYAIGKKEKPPFLPEEPSSSSSSEEVDPVPDEFLCLICKDTMTDAAIIPCCGNSYCDECIRTALLESDEHTCPTCHQNDVSPDALVANKVLRQAVNNFKNQTDYTKRLGKQVTPSPPPLPPPSALIQQNLQPPMKSLTSRQQDPLKIPMTSSSASAHPTPSVTSLASNSSSSAPSVPGNPSPAPAPVPETTARVSVSDLSEKSDGSFRESENQLLPAAALTSEHSKGASSIAVTAPMEEKRGQVAVLETPPSLGQSLLHEQSIPTTGPVRINAAHPSGGQPGWEHSNKIGKLVSPTQQIRSEERSCYRGIKRGRDYSEPSQRSQGPSRPATPVFVPIPPPLLPPSPPHMLPLPPGVPAPRFPPRVPPGQPPTAGYSVPPPGFPPAPANISTACFSPGVPTAHSNTMPTTQAPLLSREEFYREQKRLKEESKFPYSGSSYSRSSYTDSKSRSGSAHSRSYSQSFSCSHSRSSSRSSPSSRRGRGKICNDCSQSRSHGYRPSRSRSPPYRRYRSRSRSPPAFRGQSPTKLDVPREEKERYQEWERKYYQWYENRQRASSRNTA